MRTVYWSLSSVVGSHCWTRPVRVCCCNWNAFNRREAAAVCRRLQCNTSSTTARWTVSAQLYRPSSVDRPILLLASPRSAAVFVPPLGTLACGDIMLSPCLFVRLSVRQLPNLLTRDVREWLSTFPFPPIPIYSIPIPSHPHSQVFNLIPFAWDSRVGYSHSLPFPLCQCKSCI